MKLSIIAMAIALAGCASPDYIQYAKSTESASIARSNALMKIAESGDTAAVAATMALALGAGQSQLQAPQPNQVLQWASVLVPGLVQAYGIKQNANVSINASNNAAAVAGSTNATMAGIAGLIQAAPTVTTLSGVGTLGSGTYNPPSNIPVTVVQPVVPTVPVVVAPDTVVVPDTVVITPVIQ